MSRLRTTHDNPPLAGRAIGRADGAVAIAASIFLDSLNIFLLLLEPSGGSRE